MITGPRLALGNNRALRKPEKHLEALDRWALGFRKFFPEGHTGPVWHRHLPADQRLVDPPSKFEHRRRALRALLESAGNLAANPKREGRGIVYAAVFLPKPFMSEVGVFFDIDYARDFERRPGPHQIWRSLGERSFLSEFNLEVPTGFVERGYRETSQGDDEPFEQEVWMIREPIDGR